MPPVQDVTSQGRAGNAAVPGTQFPGALAAQIVEVQAAVGGEPEDLGR